MTYEYTTGGKWLELLKEIAPNLARAAVLRDSATATGIGLFGAIQSAGASLRVDVKPANVRNADEIERVISAMGDLPNGGLIITSGSLTQRYRDIIIAAAARHRLPAAFHERAFVAHGGLLSYGADYIDQFRRAAGYVDRILKGEKPSDLPVQAPVKYELVINLKTARTLGLTVPPMLLARADELIE